MIIYLINDNRGTKTCLMPNEAFSVVKQINGVNVLTEHHYTRDEAEQSIELRIKRQSNDEK